MDQTDQTEQTEHLAKVERLRQLLTGILPSRPTRPCRRCAPPHPFHYLVSPVLESARNEDIGEEPVEKDVQEKLIYDNDKDESVDESVKESRNPTLISNEGGSKNRSKEESDEKKPDTTSPDIIPRTPPMCGNERYLDRAKIIKSCTRKALLPCSVCKLIEYCSEKCRLEHRNDHAHFCTAPFMCENWDPRESAMADAAKGYEGYGPSGRPLWGKGAAFSLLSGRPGIEYTEDINILVSVSGDLRHVISTINSLPLGYSKTCDITLNDPNVNIVIRNAFMLMIAFLYPNKPEAAHAIVQLWYSIGLSKIMWQKIKSELLPFVQRAWDRKKKGKATSQISQRWTKEQASMRLTLTRRQWKQMMELLTADDDIDYEEAVISRHKMIAEKKEEMRRNMKIYEMPVDHRRSHARYLNTGMLVPFGYPVGKFNVPNPTLFTSDAQYLNTSDDTPLEGWELKEVLETGKRFSCLEHDLYAALGKHVGINVYEFIARLFEFDFKTNFHLYSVETRQLDGTLGNNKAHHANGLGFLQIIE